ncbi:MAG: exodeoxyribonuclease VII large subunit [Actinomycetota bacterium]|nr:exodeoxyribonuclease VII large subunit [Actinomycetota bacterium]
MTLFSPATDAMGIRDLYRRVSLAITRGMRGEVWVRAEISTVRERDENRWCFLTLAEPARDFDERDAFLDVVVWKAPWSRIRRQLDERGLRLREGMTVSLRGEVCLKPGTGQLQLKCSALDTDALLGELTARRRALRRRLEAEGLLHANARVPLSPVPLRVGVVASHHSQGYEDFRKVLDDSGYAFSLIEKPVVVQGVGAPRELARALTALSKADVDVVVVVRGGGARGDLDAFDSEMVARAVASAAVPVWTGVGHTGDRYLADEVAAASHATPTACAQALVTRVAQFEGAVGQRIQRLRDLARRAGETAHDQLERRRHLVVVSAAGRLDRRGDALADRARAVQRTADRLLAEAQANVRRAALELPALAVAAVDDEDTLRSHRSRAAARLVGECLRGSRTHVDVCASRIRTGARRAVEANEREVSAVRRVMVAYDPARQLERGWTLTLGVDGVPVRRAAELRPGQRIVSRFVDGESASVVETTATAP